MKTTEKELKEQVIKDLNDFYNQLTETSGYDKKNDIFHVMRGLAESYESVDCIGNWKQGINDVIFVQTKNTKKTFVFSSDFGDQGNATQFNLLLKELVG